MVAVLTMILTDKQKLNLAHAVMEHVSPFDERNITLFRMSNKKLQQFWAFGAEARMINELLGFTFLRTEEWPYSLGYVTFSRGGFNMLYAKIPHETKVDIIYVL